MLTHCYSLHVGKSFQEFLDAPVEDIIRHSTSEPVDSDTKTEVGEQSSNSNITIVHNEMNVSKFQTENSTSTSTTEATMKTMNLRVFEGQVYSESKDISPSKILEQKRIREERTVKIGGMDVLRETIGLEQWTSVATHTGTNDFKQAQEAKKSLKRKKWTENQEVCYHAFILPLF